MKKISVGIVLSALMLFPLMASADWECTFNKYRSTGIFFLESGRSSLEGLNLETGDQLLVLDSEGNCVGEASIDTTKNFYLNIWGKDPVNHTGIAEGERFYLFSRKVGEDQLSPLGMNFGEPLFANGESSNVYSHEEALVVNEVTRATGFIDDFQVEVRGSDLHLSWKTSGADFSSFNVIRNGSIVATTIEQEQVLPGLDPGTHACSVTGVTASGDVVAGPTVESFIGDLGKIILSSAFPNPAIASTSIEMQNSREQEVRVEIFDVLGRKVAEVFQGPMERNEQKRFTIDVSSLSAGKYYVRFQAESSMEVIPVTVVK